MIALLHGDPDNIPFGKSEQNPELRERLRSFRDRVAADRLVKFWKTADELPGLVSLSLSKAIKMFPAVGWVRASKTASEDLLAEINELRKENARLQETLADLSGKSHPTIENLASLDEPTVLHGQYFKSKYGFQKWEVTATWSEIFGYISPYLLKYANENQVAKILADALFPRSGVFGSSATLDDQDFQTVAVQLRALACTSSWVRRIDCKLLQKHAGICFSYL